MYSVTCSVMLSKAGFLQRKMCPSLNTGSSEGPRGFVVYESKRSLGTHFLLQNINIDKFLKILISSCNFVERMEEGTLKTPIPICRLYWLYWSFLFGVVKQFCRF